MRCQYCNCAESKVIDSRPTEEGNSIRRRRECMGCGRRFTTYEKIEMLPLMVVKRDGRRETFDAQKIKAGILHACEKLPVSMQQIDAMTTSIEQRAYASMEGEISSQRIGDMVMEELKATNDVAYVRFAAVYRLFTDIGTFMQELQKLLDEGEKVKKAKGAGRGKNRVPAPFYWFFTESWGKSSSGALLRERRVTGRDASLPAPLLSSVWHTGRPWNSWGVAPNPTRDAVP